MIYRCIEFYPDNECFMYLYLSEYEMFSSSWKPSAVKFL